MAEEKIIKHTGDAAHALLKKNVPWKKKMQEFFFEIFIIVIAVSITLWFHNLNDHLHEKRLEKDFLAGIRQDLKITADKLDADRLTFQHTLDYYDTTWKQIRENRVDKPYMDSASGNLRLIENHSLMQDITRMFTVTLPDREASDRIIFQERHNQYITYIGTRTPIGPRSNSQISGVLNDPAIRFQVMWQGALLNEMKEQKIKLVKGIRDLIAEIDSEMKE